MYLFNLTNTSLLLSDVSVGVHYYWNIGGFTVHGQVFMVIWFVMFVLIAFSFLGASKLERIPNKLQSFTENLISYTSDIAKDQIGESLYRPWIPFISTLFLFILICNWSGALIPWKFFELRVYHLLIENLCYNTNRHHSHNF
jgi:F-type H+-transporting ATPase subunit a